MRIGDETATATAQDFGLTWENTEVVEEAMALGKSGNIIKRYKDTKDLENHTTTFELTYEPDESLVADFVERMAQTYDREATDGSLYRDSQRKFCHRRRRRGHRSGSGRVGSGDSRLPGQHRRRFGWGDRPGSDGGRPQRHPGRAKSGAGSSGNGHHLLWLHL